MGREIALFATTASPVAVHRQHVAVDSRCRRGTKTAASLTVVDRRPSSFGGPQERTRRSCERSRAS